MDKVLKLVSNRGGFLTEYDVVTLLHDHFQVVRLLPVLVRCGGARFTCALQDLSHMKGAIESVGDYIRDISIPHSSQEWRRVGYYRSSISMTR